jgi:flagellar protein FliO/FliZ
MDSSAVNLLQIVFALGFVVGLMWLMGFLIRRYGEKLGLPVTMPVTGKNRRLQLLEVLPLDPRNKLVLVRQDSSEHLILIGQNEAAVIKKDISKQPETA